MILILTPTRHEASDFIRRLREVRHRALPGTLYAVEGKLAGRLVHVVEIGMGETMAARRTRAALEGLPRPAVVWLVGFGGGLDPTLRHADITLLEHTPGSLPPAAPLPIHRRIDRLHTGAEVVATGEAKATLFRLTGAPVVEMEAAAVFTETDRAKLPVAAVRVISDTAAEALPADLLACGYDMNTGRDTPLRMILRLLTHPRDIGRLRRFLATLKAPRAKLADFLEAAVRARAHTKDDASPVTKPW